ncbi:MAG: nucleotide exchange factor GrpE [Pseudomonadota bacterium]
MSSTKSSPKSHKNPADAAAMEPGADTPLAEEPTPKPEAASEAYETAQANRPHDAMSQAEADAMADMAAEAQAMADEEHDDPDNVEPMFDPAEEIEVLNRQVDELRDRLLRAAAETENVRRRADKEKTDASKFAVSRFAEDMLSVADNFARSLDAVPAEAIEAADDRIKNLIGGIKAVDKELQAALNRHGVTQIAIAEDEIFDPNKHEVMFEAEDASKPRGTIMQVLQPGYMVHERLLRPARVGVTKGGSDGPVDSTA